MPLPGTDGDPYTQSHKNWAGRAGCGSEYTTRNQQKARNSPAEEIPLLLVTKISVKER